MRRQRLIGKRWTSAATHLQKKRNIQPDRFSSSVSDLTHLKEDFILRFKPIELSSGRDNTILKVIIVHQTVGM